MYLAATSKEYVLAPLFGPPGADLSGTTPSMAILAEAAGEPLAGDWQAAEWMEGGHGPEVARLVDASGYAPGDYLVWVKIAYGDEAPVLLAGRLRIGDSR